MFGQKRSLLSLSLACALVTGISLQGCSNQELTVESIATDSHKMAQASPKPNVPRIDKERSRYTSDLDRLGQLAERINRACGRSHLVLLGADNSPAGGGPVAVDYALFDKLSDEGAAVLIAEAIVSRRNLPLATREQANTARLTLQTDESVGRYVARAGFGSNGFGEWLEANKVLTVGPKQSMLTESQRVAAFIRGYFSETQNRTRQAKLNPKSKGGSE